MNDHLPVGHPTRRATTSALWTAFAVTAVFAAVTIISKEDTALNVAQPWQDDPYDVLVSLDFVVLPLLVVISVVRSLLCRKDNPLPARRLTDLLRAAATALVACLITETAEWIAVILGRHRSTWTAPTVWQIAALGILTAATLCAIARCSWMTREVARAAEIASQPDWLADFVALGLRSAEITHAGSTGVAVRWLDENVVTRVRQHSVAAACVVAAGLASPYIAAKVVIERYPPVLVLVVSAFIFACMLVLVVGMGRILRIVAPQGTEPSTAVTAVLAGCLSGATLFAFHDSLLARQTVTGLALLLVCGFTAGAAGSLAVEALRRRNHRSAHGRIH